jgi:NAD(P)-dependent dehydrogenase (short-subunit alcohol dehydrogenase family)
VGPQTTSRRASPLESISRPGVALTATRTAIVTAAGKGIGEAIARRLSADGYDLMLMSTSGGAERLAAELDAVGLTGSVTEPDDLQRLVDTALDRFGHIDAVVNNTGHPPKGDLLDIPDDDWHHALDLVLLNVVRMARLVTPTMQAQGGGAIVNISTFSAYEPGLAFPVSSTLRAGLGSFAKLYSDRYGPDGIRMNNVLPGFMDSYPESDETLARIPVGRYGRVAELAGTVAFLLSPDGAYITGQNLRVDGGMTRSV